MALPNDRTKQALDEADWDDIALKLIRFALYLMKEKRIKFLPDGMDHEDVAICAMQKVITGQRSWDPVKHPNLLTHLKWIVKSDLSENGLLGKNTDEEPVYTDDDELLDFLHDNPFSEGSEEESFIPALLEEIEGDDRLELIVLAIIEGAIAPAEIAEGTGIPLKDVYSARRKLQRKMNKAMEKMAGAVEEIS